jgi:hypothetical protein
MRNNGVDTAGSGKNPSVQATGNLYCRVAAAGILRQARAAQSAVLSVLLNQLCPDYTPYNLFIF